MFGFHTGTVTDSASSPWWSWPLMFRLDGANVPRWFDITRNLPSNTVSTITAFGNPAVWWIGFAAMIVLALRAFHVELLLTKLWGYISKSSVKQRISLRGNGWEVPAHFHSRRLRIQLVTLRLHRTSSIHLPLLQRCTPALLSHNILHKQVLA